MNNLKTIFSQSGERSDYFNAYFSYVSQLLMDLDPHAIDGVVDCFLTARDNKRTIFFAGQAVHNNQKEVEDCGEEAGSQGLFQGNDAVEDEGFIKAGD